MPYKNNSELPEMVRKNLLYMDRTYTGKLSTVHGKSIKISP